MIGKLCAGMQIYDLTINFNIMILKAQNIRNEDDILYLKNAYRISLTRERQSLIIFMPKGEASDKTMNQSYHNGIYKYFKEIGIQEI